MYNDVRICHLAFFQTGINCGMEAWPEVQVAHKQCLHNVLHLGETNCERLRWGWKCLHKPSLQSTKIWAVHFYVWGNQVEVTRACDFDLIPKMKEPLCGIHFRTVPEILQAVDRSIRTINTTGAAKGILRLPHRWQRVVHNAGDFIAGQ